MKTKRTILIAGTASAAAAFVCFSLMDSFAEYSITQDMLNYAGYALIALTLFLYFRGMQLPE